ncbi:hypothetical protein GJ689_07750 [Rhodoplanes serenus]|uniref:Uncharacterized protein n=1 Tax=Rhodoplanes serenus TaxID=200615 RepID=A0A9X5ASC3_9BRAD|nr:hypothetical protein [Rhodoplanes serenus]MTW16100.1 hypothetical protein [Rhodoplanes serenus]
MSALVGFLQRDRVHLAVDGANYTADGTIGSFGDKAMVLPHLGMAIAARGVVWLLPALVSGISLAFASFDEAAGELSDFLRDLIERNRSVIDLNPNGAAYEVAAAGWSSADGPSLVVVKSYGSDAWKTQHVGAYLAPCDGTLLDELATRGAHPEQLADADPVAAAQTIIHEQRRRAWVGPAGETQAIGGFVALTTCGRDEITTRIVKRWPQDRVGERIRAEVRTVA